MRRFALAFVIAGCGASEPASVTPPVIEVADIEASEVSEPGPEVDLAPKTNDRCPRDVIDARHLTTDLS